MQKVGWLERRCQGGGNLEVDGPTLRLVSRERERERGTMDDGGWKKGGPKVPGRTQRRSFPVFPHFKLSSGPTSLTRRHHTNQKTCQVSSDHGNDRWKREIGKGTRGWRYRRRQNRRQIGDANICLDVYRRNVDIPMVQWVCENMNVMEERRSLPFFESFCFFPFLFSFLFCLSLFVINMRQRTSKEQISCKFYCTISREVGKEEL